MLFTLEVLPAAEGDCLLLHWGTKTKPKLAVIDGGPGKIYENHLRPRLEEILANHGGTELELELLMISHMDDDHIIGIKKLIREVRGEIEEGAQDRPFVLRRLWHNVFNDILGDAVDKYFEKFTSSFTASVRGEPHPDVVKGLAKAFRTRQGESKARAEADAHDVAMVLAGHNDGRAVRDDYEFLFKRHLVSAMNSVFKNSQGKTTLVMPESAPKPLKVEGLEFRIAGPQQPEIEALQKEFDKYIEKNGMSAEAVLAAYADRSIKNLSSIVCLAEFGDDPKKTILFTGDARGDKILEGLEATGLLKSGKTMSVDVLKVPHHGSDRNVEPEFFKRIVADTYVLSGDGKNGNPDRDTLQWIADARGKSATFEIVLTYPLADIDVKRKAEFAKKDKPWKASRDSLEAFFQKTTSEGYAFTLVTETPYKIDLGGDKVTW